MKTIQKARVQAGLTQTEVAIKLNVNQSAVSQWETGESKPRLDMLIKLAQTLNCSIEYLLNNE